MSLSEQVGVAGVAVPNRAVFRPVRTRFVDDGVPTDELAPHLAARVEGGVGLVVGPAKMLVHPSASGPAYVDAYDEEAVEALRGVQAAVHETGGKIFGQLTHPGAEETGDWEMQPQFAPSAAPSDAAYEMPKSMSRADLEGVREGFVAAAENLERIGFDGIELCAGPFSLLRQFLSPRYNSREDGYGGDLAARARFVNETIDAVTDAVDCPVGLHLSLAELEYEGYDFEDAPDIVDHLDGYSYLSCTVGTRATFDRTHASAAVEPPPLVKAIAEVSPQVDVPVMGRAPFTTPENAGDVLAAGADFVCFTRQLLADPDTLWADDDATVDRCIQCNQKCLQGIYGHAHGGHVECVVNPRTGREASLDPLSDLDLAARERRVLVVGGGAAGLRFATVAARRGHDVVLREAGPELGGQLLTAARGVFEPFTRAVEDLETAVRAADVTVETRTEVTPETVEDSWDAVVVATGADEGGHDFEGSVTGAYDVLGGAETGDPVLLVDHNRWVVTLQTALELAARGCTLEIVTSDHYPGFQTEQPNLPTLISQLQARGVTFTGNHDVDAVGADGTVTLRNVLTGATTTRSPDDVVYAGRREANESLYAALTDEFDDVYRIGDAVAPRKLDRAYYDGELLARRL